MQSNRTLNSPPQLIVLGGFLDGVFPLLTTNVINDVKALGGVVIPAPRTRRLFRLWNNWIEDDWSYVINWINRNGYGDSPFVIVGHSDGAPITFRVCAEHPMCFGAGYHSGVENHYTDQELAGLQGKVVVISRIRNEGRVFTNGANGAATAARNVRAAFTQIELIDRTRAFAMHMLGLAPHIPVIKKLIKRVSERFSFES